MAVRVGVADDSFLIREALTRLLGDGDEIELVAVCADGDELAAAVDACHPDVVLRRHSDAADDDRRRHPPGGPAAQDPSRRSASS